MEFSIFLIGPTQGQGSDSDVLAAMLNEIGWAEDLGFDAAWIAEHHFDELFCTVPSPNLIIAAASQLTKRIKLGCGINVLPFHHATRIAEEGAMLDQLTKGRFQWGIGRGITGHEFASLGLDAANSRAAFSEIHDAVLDAWKTGTMSYQGEVVKVPPTQIAPRVVQAPHPPVWVTAQSPDSVAWAAARDYPAMQIGEDLEMGRRQVAHYRASAAKAGTATKRGGIVPLRMVFVADSDAEARDLVAQRVVDFWDHTSRTTAPYAKSPGAGQGTPGYEYWLTQNPQRFAKVGYDGLMEMGLVLSGSPGTVIDQVRRQAEALECRHIMCDFWRTSQFGQHEKAMRLFAQEVMPAFA